MKGVAFSRRRFLQAGAILAAGFPAARTQAEQAESGGGTLRIAHLCDPQFGFANADPDRTRYKKDLACFEREMAKVNELKPDIALIAGDMTHISGDVTLDWPRLLKGFTMPVAVTPGNHDLGNTVTEENLNRYLGVFGYDYKRFEVKGWRLLVGNSQLWYKSDNPVIQKRKAEYDQWVKDELAAASSLNGRVILATHIPPFDNGIGEKDSYNNYPQATRRARMEAYLAAGVRFYLSGHLHRMSMRGWRDLTILNGEATSVNFDERPHGFRMFEIAPDLTYSWSFIPV